MSVDKIQIIHQGRGGYLEYDGAQYSIEHVENGCFSIHFPSENTHSKLQEHLDTLNLKQAKARNGLSRQVCGACYE